MSPASLASPDPVVEAYKKDIDRTLIREMLRLTPEQRILKLQDYVAMVTALRERARARGRDATGD